MRWWSVLVAAASLAGCSTRPLLPDATIDPTGDYRIIAVNGAATGGGGRFRFDIHPPTGEAQFGCNETGGSLAVSNGYVTTGEWIITTASCMRPDEVRFEREGFAVTALPMAVQRSGTDAIRLSNRLGSFELLKAPPMDIAGDWRAVAVGGIPLADGDRFSLAITPETIRTIGICNNLFGHYLISKRFLVPNGTPWPRSERGCSDPTGKRDPMALEDRVYAVFWYAPKIRMPDTNRLHFESARGSIDLVRR